MSDPDRRVGAVAIGLPSWLALEWPIALGFLALLVAPFDEAIVRLINPDQPIEWLDSLAVFLDKFSTRIELGVLLTFFFAAFMLPRFSRHRSQLSAFVLTWLSMELVVGTIKRTANRPRPCHPDGMQDQIRVLFDHCDLKSFPSGHSAMAFAVAVFVSAWRPKRWYLPLIWLLAGAIATGRIYIGAHHLSDCLAGAAFGWFFAAASWKAIVPGEGLLTPFFPPRRLAPVFGMIWLILLGWLAQKPLELRDSLTGESLEGWRLPAIGLKEVLLEPLYGPSTKLGSLPDLGALVVSGGAWCALLAALVFFIWRWRALPWLIGFAVLAALWGWLTLAGLPGWSGSPQLKSGHSAWAFDVQSHIGDPYDGGIAKNEGLRRFRKLGYSFVVPTWHNSWAKGMLVDEASEENSGFEFWGSEWSQGDPMKSNLHLLVFNTKQEPDLAACADYKELITKTHAAGGVVIASHFWRRDATTMPSLQELLDAGIDGFEVAGRNEESSEDALSRQAAIRDAVQEHGLVGLGNSDFHGKRSGNHVWNFVPTAEGGGVQEQVWRVLKGEKLGHQVVSVHADPQPGFLAAPMAAWSYLREMTILRRLAWFFWLVLLGGLLWWRDTAQAAHHSRHPSK